MHRLVLIAALLLPQVATAQQPDCDAQAALVMTGVEARADGASRDEARTILADGVADDAAGMLVQWIYSLPEEQLTDAVGEAWRTQCEAM